MASFATIHEKQGKFTWHIFSYNMRLIAQSSRSFNQLHHARDALKRFVRALGNVDIRAGIVRER
jgi:hypothetical protein